MKIELQGEGEDKPYSSRLSVGDYIPYFVIHNDENLLDMQAKASRYNLLIFIPQGHDQLVAEGASIPLEYPRFTISDAPFAEARPDHFFDAQVFRLFADPDAPISVILCDRNLKICFANSGDDWRVVFDGMPTQEELQHKSVSPPVLLVPEVIGDDLATRLCEYIDQRDSEAFKNRSDYKSRSHIHPSKELELELDDKLSKSLLPEIEKVFYSDISHRETYKVCCYEAESSGRFGKHRDTIDPHLHRRYALTLALNDAYAGGGICFPEYSDELIEVPKGWAVVFPGSLIHRVDAIGSGRRYVLVSFFFTEAEAQLKEGSERYRFRVQRDKRGLHLNKLTPDYES